MQFVKNGYIDLSFENVFYADEYIFYDQEWYLENLPLEFILYRAINNLYIYFFTTIWRCSVASLYWGSSQFSAAKAIKSL